MEAAMHRVPALESAGVKILLNGPESFTPDGNFILGEAPEVRNYFVAAGFNSAGIANAGGAGKLLAEWIAGGEAPMDLFEVDIRPLRRLRRRRQWLRERTVETLGLHYAMRWPRHELESGARSDVHLVLTIERQGAPVRLQVRLGAPNYFGPRWNTRLGARTGWRRVREQTAIRNAWASSTRPRSASCACAGRDAGALLDASVRNRIGKLTYTRCCNRKGGFESDVTVQRWATTTSSCHRLGTAGAGRGVASATHQAARDVEVERVSASGR
jgi:4-methylaminobutanoate oxidase (formaldehyde-forming)